MRWLRYGLVLDVSLLIGVITLMAASRISREESGVFRAG
jgi:hypothetical protein